MAALVEAEYARKGADGRRSQHHPEHTLNAATSTVARAILTHPVAIQPNTPTRLSQNGLGQNGVPVLILERKCCRLHHP